MSVATLYVGGIDFHVKEHGGDIDAIKAHLQEFLNRVTKSLNSHSTDDRTLLYYLQAVLLWETAIGENEEYAWIKTKKPENDDYGYRIGIAGGQLTINQIGGKNLLLNTKRQLIQLDTTKIISDNHIKMNIAG